VPASALGFLRAGGPIERERIIMKREVTGFAAATALSLALMLTPHGPAFAEVFPISQSIQSPLSFRGATTSG
jgi:hypothetical protein